jgi:hypothetical protein
MANAGEIVSYTGIGAGIGTAILPGVGTAVGAGIGALAGVGKGWYDRNKAGKERRWQENELLRQYQALEALANNQTAGQQDAINKQLGIESKNLASTFATSGGIRTGNYQRKVGELNSQAVTDVANVSRQNALQAKMMEMGYTQQVKNFNLELAKLESAKGAGDAQMAMSAGENIAPILMDWIGKMGGGGETTVSKGWEGETGGLNDNPDPYYYQDEQQAYTDPALDYVRSLYKPKPLLQKGVGGFAPRTDNTDPVSVLWGE